VLNSGPDVLNHNVETVPSLYGRVRPQAVYRRSVGLLGRAKAAGAVTKSGLMLGLGEREEEIISVMDDLLDAGCDILTLGHYLQPRRDLLPVARYYRPEEFESLRDRALQLGFRYVEAGPLVRSSYQAGRYGMLNERAGQAPHPPYRADPGRRGSYALSNERRNLCRTQHRTTVRSSG
jgi:lipoic acid synthetase